MTDPRLLPARLPSWLLWAVPLASMVVPVVLWATWRGGYWAVVGEDRLAEWVTFFAYVAAAGLAIAMVRRLARAGLRFEAALYVLLTCGLVFVAGEEVSWFQRQLGFAGPDALVAKNLQGEANLHNLLGRLTLEGSFILVGLYGAVLGRLLIPRLPRLRERPELYVPPTGLVLWFGCVSAYYAWADYLNPVLTKLFGSRVDVLVLTGPKLQETAEMVLSLGFLLFLLSVFRRPGSSRRDGAVTSARSDRVASGRR